MQVSRQELENYRWLVSEAADPYLQRAAEYAGSPIALAKQLRRDLSADRSRLVAEQAELRGRAAIKFARAPQMFFTRRLLEQATDDRIAAYKAARFPAAPRIFDLCCGIGGDLAALAGRGAVCGIDRDPTAALLARANCRHFPAGVETLVAEVNEWIPTSEHLWHLDPDRRPAGRRVTRIEDCLPGPATIRRITARSPSGAVKLAPATVVPDAAADVECEWIGSRGECRQQVVWHGDLAGPVRRRATVVTVRGRVAGQVGGNGDEPIPLVAAPGRFLFEPHAAVLAARLEGVLAARYGLARFSAIRGYLTGDQLVDEPLVSAFAVLEVMRLDVKQLGKWLRQRGIGRLEIKRRGIPLDPDQLRRKLKLAGDGQAVLLVAAQPGKTLSIIAERQPGAAQLGAVNTGSPN